MKEQCRRGAIELLDSWRNCRGWGQCFLILGRKFKSSSGSAWHMQFPWYCLMQSCSCLLIYLFMAAWRWPISAKFDRVAVVSRVLSSWGSVQTSNRDEAHLPFLLREEQQFELSCGVAIQREGYQKPQRSLLKLGESKLPARSPPTETIPQKVLRCRLGLQVSQGAASRARPCSLKEERSLTQYSLGTAFCYLWIRSRWQDSKGRRKKGSR